MDEGELLELLESLLDEGELNQTGWEVVRRQVERQADADRRSFGVPSRGAVRRLLERRKPGYPWA